MEHLYQTVAFYLADGTTARKAVDIPLQVDNRSYVDKLIKQAKQGASSISVNSLDDDLDHDDSFSILPEHIVAYKVIP